MQPAALATLITLIGLGSGGAADPVRSLLWEGNLHLGDNSARFWWLVWREFCNRGNSDCRFDRSN